METKNKTFQEKKSIFEKLKTAEKSVLFSEEKLNIKLVKKLKKSKYYNAKMLSKLTDLVENSIEQLNKNNNKIIPIRLDYVEKIEIDRSTLYSLDGPFQLIHANIANLGISRWISHNTVICLVSSWPVFLKS